MGQKSSTLSLVRPTRVIVADPYPVILQGLRKILEDDPRFQVVAEASNMAYFWKKVVKEQPEVALLDWSMASQDLAATTALLQSDLHTASLIFLTASKNSREKGKMFRLGASGFLCKWSSARMLQSAVFNAGKGRLALDESATDLPGGTPGPSSTGSVARRIKRLTHRERLLLPLVCRGLKNKEIALRLSIAESTVWHHLTSIFKKLQVDDRLGLAAYVYHHHLVLSDGGSVAISPKSTSLPGSTAQAEDRPAVPSLQGFAASRSPALKYPPAALLIGNEPRARSPK